MATPSSNPLPVNVFRYRVLFSDGATVDYLGVAQDNRAMIQHHFPSGGGTIAGAVNMGVEYQYTPTVGP